MQSSGGSIVFNKTQSNVCVLAFDVDQQSLLNDQPGLFYVVAPWKSLLVEVDNSNATNIGVIFDVNLKEQTVKYQLWSCHRKSVLTVCSSINGGILVSGRGSESPDPKYLKVEEVVMPDMHSFRQTAEALNVTSCTQVTNNSMTKVCLVWFSRLQGNSGNEESVHEICVVNPGKSKKLSVFPNELGVSVGVVYSIVKYGSEACYQLSYHRWDCSNSSELIVSHIQGEDVVVSGVGISKVKSRKLGCEGHVYVVNESDAEVAADALSYQYPLAYTSITRELQERNSKKNRNNIGLFVDSLWSMHQSYFGEEESLSRQIKDELYEIAICQNLTDNSVIQLLGNRHHLHQRWLSSLPSENDKQNKGDTTSDGHYTYSDSLLVGGSNLLKKMSLSVDEYSTHELSPSTPTATDEVTEHLAVESNKRGTCQRSVASVRVLQHTEQPDVKNQSGITSKRPFGPEWYKYDVTGASLIHQIYLARKYSQGRSLVRQYPEFCLEGMSNFVTIKPPGMDDIKPVDMPFTGENILHLTILQGNREEARWLMDYYRKRSLQDLNTLLSARVTGSYFRPNGTMYYGETPLHFAVCTNDCEMFDLVLSYVSVLHNFRDLFFAPDSHGNNLVHLCVLNGLPNMYTHIKMRTQNILRQELMSAWHESQTLPCYDPRRRHYTPTPLNRCVDGENHGGYIMKPRNIPLPHNLSEDIVKVIHAVKVAVIQRFFDVVNDPMKRNMVYDGLYERWKGKGRIRNSKSDFAEWVAPDPARPLVLNKADLSAWKAKKKSPLLERWIFQRWEDLFNSEDDSEALPKCIGWSTDLIKLDKEIIENVRNFVSCDADEIRNNEKLLELVDLWLIGSYLDNSNNALSDHLDIWLNGSTIEMTDGAIRQLYENRFILNLNNDGHTPLSLAAKDCHKEMLDLFVKEASYVRISGDTTPVVTINLAGIEFPLPKTNNGEPLYDPPIPRTIKMRGALQLICAGPPTKLQDIFQISELTHIIETKWERTGKPIMTRNFLVSIMLTVLLSLLSCLATQGEVKRNGVDIYRSDTYFFSAAAAVVFFTASNEMPSMLAHRLDYWGVRGGLSGIAILDKVLSFSIFALFSVSFVAMIRSKIFNNNTVVYHSTLACATLLSWLHNFVYFTVLQKFGPFMTKVTKILRKDVLYFCQMYIVILVGFGITLTLISEPSGPDFVRTRGAFNKAFVSMWELVKLTFNVNTGNVSPLTVENVADQTLKPLFGFIMFLYSVLITILLLNLLIAMMTRTYEDYTPSAEAKSLAHHYNLMVGMHRAVSPDTLTQLENKYSFTMEVYESNLSNSSVAKNKFHDEKMQSNTDQQERNPFKKLKRVECRRYFEMPLSALHEKPQWMESSEEQPIETAVKTFRPEELATSDIRLDVGQTSNDDVSSRLSILIFLSNFWVNIHGNHPEVGQHISSTDMLTGIWKPSNFKNADFCVYFAHKLRKEGKTLVIQNKKRNVLLIIHPQNDFHDFVPNYSTMKERVPRKYLYRQDEPLRPRSAHSSASSQVQYTGRISTGERVDMFVDTASTVEEQWIPAIVVAIHQVHDENSTTPQLLFDLTLITKNGFEGSLPASGSCADSFRIAKMIEKNWRFFDDIIVTQDSHYRRHISNQSFWKVGAGAMEDLQESSKAETPVVRPAPFSEIRYVDVRKKKWVPDEEEDNALSDLTMDNLYGYCLNYSADLERNKRFLTAIPIWPDHCLIGSEEHNPDCVISRNNPRIRNELSSNINSDNCYVSMGHQVFKILRYSLRQWKNNWKNIEKVQKAAKVVRSGMNCFTEMYSILKAENGDIRDPLCGINSELLDTLSGANDVFVCGQALSHCVGFSLQDLIHYTSLSPSNFTLLLDGTSPIAGYEKTVQTTLENLQKIGLKTMCCRDVDVYSGFNANNNSSNNNNNNNNDDEYNEFDDDDSSAAFEFEEEIYQC